MAIGAVASYAIPALIGYLGQQSANKSNEANSANANATSIELANTSYQRRVADLKAAGLNPMLAYTQGGAAVPNMQVPNVQNPGSAGAQAGSQGATAYQAVQASKLINEQVDTQKTQQALNAALASKAMADTQVSTASAAEIAARTPVYGAQIEQLLAQVDKIASDTNLSRMQTVLAKRQATNALLTGQNIEASTGNMAADTRLKKLGYTLQSTGLPMAFNVQDKANTWFGRNITPYVQDILGTSGAYKNLAK